MQDGIKRPRGRPRSHDRESALRAVRDRFWQRGFAATSLDDLVAATGMQRPSLYASFGDKRAMYLASLATFTEDMRASVATALASPRLTDALVAFYSGALEQYNGGGETTRGCMVLCTATVEAPADADIRAALSRALDELDAALETRFNRARRDGDLPSEAEPRALAALAVAVLHSLALRVRAQTPRSRLDEIIKAACTTLTA